MNKENERFRNKFKEYLEMKKEDNSSIFFVEFEKFMKRTWEIEDELYLSTLVECKDIEKEKEKLNNFKYKIEYIRKTNSKVYGRLIIFDNNLPIRVRHNFDVDLSLIKKEDWLDIYFDIYNKAICTYMDALVSLKDRK